MQHIIARWINGSFKAGSRCTTAKNRAPASMPKRAAPHRARRMDPCPRSPLPGTPPGRGCCRSGHRRRTPRSPQQGSGARSCSLHTAGTGPGAACELFTQEAQLQAGSWRLLEAQNLGTRIHVFSNAGQSQACSANLGSTWTSQRWLASNQGTVSGSYPAPTYRIDLGGRRQQQKSEKCPTRSGWEPRFGHGTCRRGSDKQHGWNGACSTLVTGARPCPERAGSDPRFNTTRFCLHQCIFCAGRRLHALPGCARVLGGWPRGCE